MDKKKLNDDEVEFLKELFIDSDEVEHDSLSPPQIKKQKKGKLKEMDAKEILIELRENLGLTLNAEPEKSKSMDIEKSSSKISVNNNEVTKRKKKKKKIKTKEILLEIKELLPTVQENNILLKALSQKTKSIEVALKALTQKPIKIKIVK